MAKKQKIRVKLRGRDSDTAYVELPGHEPKAGIVAKMVCLNDVVDNFKGPRVNLDFNQDGVLIGIEILVYGEE